MKDQGSMIARAEMSTNPQGAPPQSSAQPKGMSVALIGPNDAHRQVVARALASAQGRKVHEFIDYPATLEELARMMETRFDVVLVDVDTDESYALQIITRLAELGPAVMAYSARTDDDLVASCMRAGASDFLPLPKEQGAEAPPTTSSAPPTASVPPAGAMPSATVPQMPAKPHPPAVQPTSRQTAPVPPPPAPAAAPATAVPPAARSVEYKPITAPISRANNVTPIASQKVAEPETNLWSVGETKALPFDELLKTGEPSAKPDQLDIFKDDAKNDFAAWDAANLRRQAMPSVARPEASARPALVPEKRKSPESFTPRALPLEESIAEVAPAPASTPVPPTPVIERPPVSTDIFRSATFQSEPSEASERQGAKWVKWMLIAAGPLVLGLVLLIVITRSSVQNVATAAKAAPLPVTVSAPAPPPPDPSANDRLIVNATGKPDAGAPVNRAQSAGVTSQVRADASSTESEEPKDVSPDAMAAQLVAPTRIAGQIKSKPPADEPPPAVPTGVSLEDNNSVSGALFGSGSKTKIAPRVVPISSGMASGMLIHRTTPVYPKYAQDAHITGTVVMKATITKQGTIEGIQVLSGPKILAPAAIDAVKTWQYRPYLLNGQPVAVETDIKVVFGGQ
jgi:TonB family protein